jgi:hypothetical protein
MSKLLSRIFSKPTFFSTSSILLFLISIPLGTYRYLQSGPSTEGWVLTFLLFLYIIIGFAYSVDRIMVKHISPIKLSVAEVVFTIICFTLINYSQRELLIDIADSKENFVVIIENNGRLKSNELISLSLFDRQIKTTESIVIVDRLSTAELEKNPSFWGQSYYYNKYSFDKYEKVVLFSNPRIDMNSKMTENFLDSLIERRK